MKTAQGITNEAMREDNHRPAPGWHLTDKYGDVFVSPDGSAWAVQQNGQRLINVKVELNPTDVVKMPAMDRVKHATAERRRYNLALTVRKRSGLPLSEAEGVIKIQDTNAMK